MGSEADGAEHSDFAAAVADVREGEESDPSGAQKQNERDEERGEALTLNRQLLLFGLFLFELTVRFGVGLNSGFGARNYFGSHFNHLRAGQNGGNLRADLINHAASA